VTANKPTQLQLGLVYKLQSIVTRKASVAYLTNDKDNATGQHCHWKHCSNFHEFQFCFV